MKNNVKKSVIDKKMKEKEKRYTIQLFLDEDSQCQLTRTNEGFNAYELLGLLERSQIDIIRQIEGLIKPDVIERKYIKP